MFLTSIAYVIAFLEVTIARTTPSSRSEDDRAGSTIASSRTCFDFGPIKNGFARIASNGFNQFAVIECNAGYDLDGAASVYCINNKWEFLPRPQCIQRCASPPHLENGSMIVEGVEDELRLFRKGSLVIYSCAKGFELKPEESKYRVCEKGIWTGPNARCEPIQRITSCPQPKDIANGYFVHEKIDDGEKNGIGQRLHYSCKTDYVLAGTPVQQCLEDGTWSPKIPPVCSLQIAEDTNDYPCPVSPTVPHSDTIVVQGYQSDSLAIPGTEVQIHCLNKYRNARAPCQPGKLRCVGGRWMGVTPVCVPVHECDTPPSVSYAVIYRLNSPIYDTATKYPIKSQISYQCLSGYTLQGNEILACSPGGCWLPMEPPTCYRTSRGYFPELSGLNAILISSATGAGVLALLLMICLIAVCRRRKPLTRAVPIAPPMPRASLGDHATLLHHPDRLALIAFADGMQNDQLSLPSYDEATRDRAPNPTSARIHRPHWPNLGVRRPRTAPNLDIGHVTRHGSFASHTPSTRSTGDSMGSTDTVAVSEGSTTVTLDTASSYSGSQPASCRVHCGSLASFDTSSILNTEGVPLLEESELEEMQGGDNISMVVDNPSISDSTSVKLSTHSADCS